MEITKIDGINPSGIEKIEMVLAKNIVGVTLPSASHEVDVTLATGTTWDKIYFTPETAKFNMTPVYDDSGVFYKIQCELAIPRTRGDLLNYLDSHRERDVVFRVTDRNHQQYLIGTNKVPARISMSNKIEWTTTNSILIKIEVSKIDDPPYVIKQNFVSIGDFNDDFNNDFLI